MCTGMDGVEFIEEVYNIVFIEVKRHSGGYN
jgi:hypothetical protein